MKNLLHHLLHNPLLIKINSFFIALFIWSLLAQWRILEITRTVPLFFHSLTHTFMHIPQAVSVTLQGPRAAFKKIDWKNFAAHIHLDSKAESSLYLTLKPEHLSLPNTIKLIRSNPTPLTLTLEKT